MTGARRAVAAAVLLGACAAGCGIPPTRVIEAGEPATGLQPPGRAKEAVVKLYFLSAAGLYPASRPAAGVVGPQDAVQLLLAGPNSAELARGLTTDLPPLKGGVKVGVRPGDVRIALPVSAAALSAGAIGQLTCTAAIAGAVTGIGRADAITVSVSGGGATRGPSRCPASSTAAAPTPTAPASAG